MVKFLDNGNEISVILNGSIKLINSKHINFKKIKKNLLKGREASVIEKLVNEVQGKRKKYGFEFDEKNNIVTYKGIIVKGDGYINLIKKYKSADKKYMKNISKFFDRVNKNPNKIATNDLYTFLIKSDLP